MPRSQFETLAETLLKGGVAPRHVRRYIAELKDHYDDLVYVASKSGGPTADAERDAFARIGTPDELANAMLARDDLKSLAARYPKFMFGIMPVLLLVLGLAVFVLGLAAVIYSFRPEGKPYSIVPDDWRTAVAIWMFFANHILPLALAALIAKIGYEQRLAPQWWIMGVAIVCILGGFSDLNVQWPAYEGAGGELQVGFGFDPPTGGMTNNVLRAVFNLLIVAVPAWFLIKRQTTQS
jgi:uncharacterized membrane protein